MATITITLRETGKSVTATLKAAPPKDKINIKILNNLDEGFYDNTSPLQKDKYGFIVGKIYKIKAEYNNVNITEVKWEFHYRNNYLSTKQGLIKKITSQGDEISFEFPSDYCGGLIIVKAYIYYKGKTIEGREEFFMHNAFRWFDRVKVENRIKNIANDPSILNQHVTPLCGTAALLYLFVSENKYKQLFQDEMMKFFRTGKGKLNNFTLDPNPEIFSMKPIVGNSDYPHYSKNPNNIMPQADWICLVGMRSSSDNKNYTGKSGETWDGINWVSYMKEGLKNLFLNNKIEDKTSIITGFDYTEDLKTIEKEYRKGKRIILLIDVDMFKDSVSYFGCLVGYHWIVYKGDLVINGDKRTFSYYCWGKDFCVNDKDHLIFRKIVFNTNYYGYIIF